MNTISDDAIVAALGRQLNAAVAKQVTAAGNLANIDTPGYKTRDVSFDDVLEGAMGKLDLQRTAAGQTGSASTDKPTVREAEGLPERRDGNNVQLDRELTTMSRAGAEFSAAQTVLAAKFRLIRYALTESR